MMRPIRRFFGFAMYLFISLPLLLGSMTLLSVRPWLTNPEAYKALVEDPRFTAVLEAPELPSHFPATLEMGGYSYEGPAAAAAFQSAIPASALVQTATVSIDTVFSAIDTGATGFIIDLAPLREALIAGSAPFAEAYLARAREFPISLPGTPPAQLLTPASLPTVLANMAAEMPPVLAVDDPSLGLGAVGQRTANLTSMRSGLRTASIWLALAAAGLTVAGAFIAEESWRKRLKLLGSRILGPGIPILVIGLIPHLINPEGLVRIAGANSMNQFPALLEYIKFASTSLSGGFMVVGLAAVGIGTALVSATHLIPPGDDDELEEIL